MKIGVSGTDSTGKTEIVQLLASKLRIAGNTVAVTSAGDVARTSPLPLAKRQTIGSSEWIYTAVSKAELAASQEADIVLCDRTILDIWAFATLAAEEDHETGRDALEDFSRKVANGLHSYAAIFISSIDHGVPVHYGNLPDGSLEIRDMFEEIILDSRRRFADYHYFYLLPHTLDERLNTIQRVIGNRRPP